MKKKTKEIEFVYNGLKLSTREAAVFEKDARDEVAQFLEGGCPSEPWAKRLFEALDEAKVIRLTVLPLDRDNKTQFFVDNMRDLADFLPKSRDNFLKDSLSQLSELDEAADKKQMLRFCSSILDARRKAGDSLGRDHDEMLAGIIKENKAVRKTMLWIQRNLEEKSGTRRAVVYDERDRRQDRAASL